MRRRQIIALGGGGFSEEPDNPLLDDYILASAERARPRVCFVPTASGDSAGYIERFERAFTARRCETSHLSLFRRTNGDLRAFILAQDVVYVGGGSTLNLLAVWRAHGLDAILCEAWERGVVLCGVSAGALCWFEGGVTDSLGQGLGALRDGLGMLTGSHSPHYDSEPGRREVFRESIQSEILPSGVAADDGVALHFVGQELHAIVSSRPEGNAYRVERGPSGAAETTLVPRYLGGAGGDESRPA